MALDLGTSTLVGALLSQSGEILASAQVANPQNGFGADILARLQRAHAGVGKVLQETLVDGLRLLVKNLLDESRCSPSEVISVAAAGNPGMACLLRNLQVDSLLFPPHRAPFKSLLQVPGDEVDLGLEAPIDLFPLVSGFVGGDLVACLLAFDQVEPGTMLIDLGTNAELALWDGDRWWVTSAAAGPAFEGGNISSGMMHEQGAVTGVYLTKDRLELTVAGAGQPYGLCGSGLTELVANALQGGLIDSAGCIRAPGDVETNLNRYLVEKNGEAAIRYYHSATTELYLTQKDVRSFQLAKGAVHAGVKVLLDKCGLSPDRITQVHLTGALGSSVSRNALKRVALLPEPMVDKTSFMKDGVLTGLQAYLLADDGRELVDLLMSRLQPLPLSGTPAFEKHFLAALNF